MTAWNDRTLEQQTAYIRKTYAQAPIRYLDGRVVHEQTPDDIRYAMAQFDDWLEAVTTSIHSDPAKEG